MRRWRGKKRRRGDGRAQVNALREAAAIERTRLLREIGEREAAEIKASKVRASRARANVWKRWNHEHRRKAAA